MPTAVAGSHLTFSLRARVVRGRRRKEGSGGSCVFCIWEGRCGDKRDGSPTNENFNPRAYPLPASSIKHGSHGKKSGSDCQSPPKGMAERPYASPREGYVHASPNGQHAHSLRYRPPVSQMRLAGQSQMRSINHSCLLDLTHLR